MICVSAWVLLFQMRNEANWVSSGLRGILALFLVILTLAFTLVALINYLSKKRKKVIIAGIIGIVPCLLAIPYFDAPKYMGGVLEQEVQTLELTYIAWACPCANWATQEDLVRYEEKEDSLAIQSIYIEPASSLFALPDTLGYSNNIIRFTGRFYQERGFPEGLQNPELYDKARVFRYTNFEVIRSNYGQLQQ
mgnify:CR=1 FL=1